MISVDTVELEGPQLLEVLLRATFESSLHIGKIFEELRMLQLYGLFSDVKLVIYGVEVFFHSLDPATKGLGQQLVTKAYADHFNVRKISVYHSRKVFQVLDPRIGFVIVDGEATPGEHYALDRLHVLFGWERSGESIIVRPSHLGPPVPISMKDGLIHVLDMISLIAVKQNIFFRRSLVCRGNRGEDPLLILGYNPLYRV